MPETPPQLPDDESLTTHLETATAADWTVSSATIKTGITDSDARVIEVHLEHETGWTLKILPVQIPTAGINHTVRTKPEGGEYKTLTHTDNWNWETALEEAVSEAERLHAETGWF